MMKQSRLDSLADGIFAIAMTILVFELRIPELGGYVDNPALIKVLLDAYPLFLSYLLSFSLLFTYWRAHHLIASVYAKNIDIKLTNISAIFFFFVALVPFSSYVLGQFHNLRISVIFFAVNVILIGFSLYWMRRYVHNSVTIENEKASKVDERHGYIRILFPVFSAVIAIIISYFNTEFALIILTVGILFNLSKRSTTIVDRLLGIK